VTKIAGIRLRVGRGIGFLCHDMKKAAPGGAALSKSVLLSGEPDCGLIVFSFDFCNCLGHAGDDLIWVAL
jgi:KaiC/GvpD/RAD55 family RecA-like ATPase